MNKYLKLINSTSSYSKQMTRLRNRIFGDVVRKTDSSSMKVVKLFSEKPIYMKDEVVNYYPRHTETHQLIELLRDYGLFRDEFEDFRDEMERKRVARGKIKGKKKKEE